MSLLERRVMFWVLVSFANGVGLGALLAPRSFAAMLAIQVGSIIAAVLFLVWKREAA